MIVQIALDLPNFEALDYLYIPKGPVDKKRNSIVGHWVVVSVKNKKKIGLVIGQKKNTSVEHLKQIQVVIDTLPPVDNNFIKFLAAFSNS